MSTSDAEDLLRRIRTVLLDFDGPVCSIFAGYPAPVIAKELADLSSAAGSPVPEDYMRRQDPMDILRYAGKIEEARAAVPGLTVRYEEITADPGGQMQRICDYIGVPFEPAMLSYGPNITSYPAGLGDWKSVIKSGSVQQGKPPPTKEETPESLHELMATWGYA